MNNDNIDHHSPELYFQSLDQLKFSHSDDYQTIYTTYLAMGLWRFTMSLGIVSEIKDNNYITLAVYSLSGSLSAGNMLPLAETYGSLIVARQEMICLPQIDSANRFDYPDKLDGHLYQSYLGIPILMDGALWGILEFWSTETRKKPFSSQEQILFSMMAKGLGVIAQHAFMESHYVQTLDNMYESASLFSSAFDNAAIGIALVSLEGQWLQTNPALSKMLGYSQTELLTLDVQSVTYPDDIASDQLLVNELLNGVRTHYHIEKRYINNDNSVLWVLLSVSLVQHINGSPRYFIFQVQDIGQRKEAESQLLKKQQMLEEAQNELIKLAMHDVLTGLANRQMFNLYCQRSLDMLERYGGTLSLVMIDIDHFKLYNDTYGHLAGDQALRMISTVMAENIRTTDLLARYGGEEFTVLMPNTDYAGCLMVSERLCDAVSKIETLECPVTISLGGITYLSLPGKRTTQEELLKKADTALYQAKTQGRNRVVHFGLVKSPLPNSIT